MVNGGVGCRLLMGLALTGLLLDSGCSGNAINGSVAGVELVAEDGFYTQFELEGVEYYGLILTDVPEACESFRSGGDELGSTWGIFQMWLPAADVDTYAVYSWSHLEEAVEEATSIAWYTAQINGQQVVNTDGVAGVVEVTEYDYEERVLSGNMDVLFSGNGNRLQGTFSVGYCDVDWATQTMMILGDRL